jgi:hypothetical protein
MKADIGSGGEGKKRSTAAVLYGVAVRCSTKVVILRLSPQTVGDSVAARCKVS